MNLNRSTGCAHFTCDDDILRIIMCPDQYSYDWNCPRRHLTNIWYAQMNNFSHGLMFCSSLETLRVHSLTPFRSTRGDWYQPVGTDRLPRGVGVCADNSVHCANQMLRGWMAPPCCVCGFDRLMVVIRCCRPVVNYRSQMLIRRGRGTRCVTGWNVTPVLWSRYLWLRRFRLSE